MSLVVYNPFVFVPLLFLFPKTAAKLLYKVDWGGYTDFWQKFYAPLVGVLPLSWKKKIMLSGGIEKISPKKQCNFILDVYTGSNDDQNTQPIHFIKKISPEAVDLLWNYYQPDDCEYWDLREKIVKAGQRLTDEQFKSLLYWKHSTLAKEYISHNYLNDQVMKYLLETNNEDEFFYCVKLYGLSKNMLSVISNDPRLMQMYQETCQTA